MQLQSPLQYYIAYFRKLAIVAIPGIVFFLLDTTGLIQALWPTFTVPRPLLEVIFVVAFIIAGAKIYGDQEEEIVRLRANVKDALNAVRQEIEINKAAAGHNASLRGEFSSPGALAFIRLRNESCNTVLFTGKFIFDNELLQIGREYVHRIDHINTLIDSCKERAERFQNATDIANGVRRYCGGQLDVGLDGNSKSVPQLITELSNQIESFMSRLLAQ